MISDILDFLEAIVDKINSGFLLVVFGIIITMVVVLHKTIGKIALNASNYFFKKKEEDNIEEIKEDVREEIIEEIKEELLTAERLKSHSMFDELRVQKKMHSKTFYTHEKEDLNKSIIFGIFVDEKLDSVIWSQTKLLDDYIAVRDSSEDKKVSMDFLRSLVLNSFLECDENLECKLSSKLSDIGVSDSKIQLIISKFNDVRAETIENYVERIEKMFTVKSGYTIPNEYLILNLFEIISFEIKGMIKEITESFESVNGAFMKLRLKK